MIYIISHKNFNGPEDSFYRIMAVGKNKDEMRCDYRDDIGEDIIAQKNQYYCELTGIYWLWKHCKDDCIGICHYRRYFTTGPEWKPDLSTVLKENDVREKLKNNDIILPPIQAFRYPIFHYVLRIYNEYEDDIFAKLRETIKEISPDYLPYFDELALGYQSHAWNMFICKKQLFDSYCEWLFSILFELEDKLRGTFDIDAMNAEQKRLFGYLSEHLITVWIRKNKIKYVESNFIFTEENRTIKGRVLKYLHYKSYILQKSKIGRLINRLYDKTEYRNKSVL